MVNKKHDLKMLMHLRKLWRSVHMTLEDDSVSKWYEDRDNEFLRSFPPSQFDRARKVYDKKKIVLSHEVTEENFLWLLTPSSYYALYEGYSLDDSLLEAYFPKGSPWYKAREYMHDSFAELAKGPFSTLLIVDPYLLSIHGLTKDPKPKGPLNQRRRSDKTKYEKAIQERLHRILSFLKKYNWLIVK